MKYYTLPYSLKVWLSSVFLAPLILIGIDCCRYPKLTNFDSIIQTYFIITIVSGVFSFVTWLIFWGAATLACHYISDRIKRKLIMCLLGIILTIITFLSLILTDDMKA
jgi:D-alanyl-lipoteichoic acid acyltransferase DltB (MBOAT superfamily)